MIVSELVEWLLECDQDKRVEFWANGWEELTEDDLDETEHDDGYEGRVKIG